MSFCEQTFAADRGPFGELTRKITLRKDLRLAEQSTVALYPNPSRNLRCDKAGRLDIHMCVIFAPCAEEL